MNISLSWTSKLRLDVITMNICINNQRLIRRTECYAATTPSCERYGQAFLTFQSFMQQLDIEGFEIVNEFYSEQEIVQLKQLVDGSDTDKPTFRRASGLFAVRQFFREFPNAFKIVFSDKFIKFLLSRFGQEYFVVKSIYFDKPGESNWFVSYHQDLTISVDKRVEIFGFGPWTVKQNQFAVQPPLEILKDNFTVRVHLDNTNFENGALRVIPKSHLLGIRRIEGGELESVTEVTCSVDSGGIMLMKPLLLHSSCRTMNNGRRRVIHIEFSRTELPVGLQWSEREAFLACP